MFAWQVFDQKLIPMLRDEYRIKQVTKVRANTLEELVQKMEGVNAERALAEIKEYNAAVQNDKPFNMAIKDGRRTQGLKIDKTNWANTLDEPPFEAFAVTCGVTFSFGGLKITNDGEVEDTGGQADSRPLRGGRARRRHFLSQLSGRHRPHVRLRVRQDRRHHRRRLRQESVEIRQQQRLAQEATR